MSAPPLRPNTARRALVWAVLVASCCALAAPARLRAQGSGRAGCGRAGRPWVSVAFRGEAWQPEQRSAVLADLAAGLALKGIDACPIGSAGRAPPLALLELLSTDMSRVAVGIEVHDALTEKRVLRDLDLRQVALDARALAIAAAADELLRASWAELTLVDAPAPSRTPPPEVERSLRHSLAPERVGARDRTVGARAVLEHHGGGLTLLGGDVFLGMWPAERAGFELGLGLRQGLPRNTEYGRIEARALTGSLDLIVAILPRREELSLFAELGVAVTSLRIRGVSDGEAEAAEGAGIDVHARGGGALSYAPLDWLALRCDVTAGVPIRSVEAAQGEQVIMATSGVELRAALGVEVRF